jgi:hypothetical protein
MQSGAFGDNLLELFRDIHSKTRHSGYQLLFKGLGPTLWRDVPFSGLSKEYSFKKEVF